MKLFLNDYLVATARWFLSGRDIKYDKDSLLKFALCVFINYRWPHLAEYLNNYPKMVEYIGENKRILKIVGIPKDLRKLFQDEFIIDLITGGPELGVSLDEKSIRENWLK